MRDFIKTSTLLLYFFAHIVLGVDVANNREKEWDRDPIILRRGETLLFDDDHILRTATKPSQKPETAKLTFLCPAKDDFPSKKIVEMVKNIPKYRYCLFEELFQNDDTKVCASPVLPELGVALNEFKRPRECFSQERGYLYTFGFRYCYKDLMEEPKPPSAVEKVTYDKDSELIKIYETCHHPKTKSTMRTDHTIVSPLLVETEEILTESIDDSELSTETFSLLDKSNKDYYKKMRNAFNSQNPNSPNYMIRRRLVPKEDMAIRTWQATTSHYANIAPLRKGLERLMDTINHSIRKLAARIKKLKRGHVYIYTVISKALSSGKEIAYIDEKTKNFPIPDLWIKFVIYRKIFQLSESILIFVHNTSHTPDEKSKVCATQLPCDFKRWSMDTLTDDEVKYAYCCKPENSVLDTFFSTFENIRDNDVLEMEKWLEDYHALAVISPKNIDRVDPLQPSYHYEVADNAGTLENGTSVYETQPHENPLLYLCPAEGEIEELIDEFSIKYQRNCLFVKNFTPDQRKNCKSLVKPELQLVRHRDGLILCAEEGLYLLHDVGHRYCGTIEYVKHILNGSTLATDTSPSLEMRFLDSYSVCYDNKQRRTAWTRHIMTSSKSPSPREISNEINSGPFNITEYFDVVAHIFEHQKKNDPNCMVPHLMVPKEDKPSEQWSRATLHYINAAPLWKELVPLMELIEERIRMLANHIEPIIVYTGVFDVNNNNILRSPYHASQVKVYIPKFWCKLILFEQDGQYVGTVVYIHNTPGQPPQDSLCEKKLNCDLGRWSTQSVRISHNSKKYAYCCAIDEKAGRLFSTSLSSFKTNLALDLNDFEIKEVLQLSTIAPPVDD